MSPTTFPASRSEACRGEAGHYDRRTNAFRQWRELLIDQLPARRWRHRLGRRLRHRTVPTAAEARVGPTGNIIGIDASEQMLQIAADRIAVHGWDNVHLIAAPVATAPIQATADAAVFCAVHDLMQCPAALGNVFDHLRPGAPVAAAGGKWPAPWMWPLRAWVTQLNAPFITDFTGFDQPWRQLAGYVPDLHVRDMMPGSMAGNPAEYSAAQ